MTLIATCPLCDEDLDLDDVPVRHRGLQLARGPLRHESSAGDHGDAIAPMIPSGRIGTPEDMAGAAIYLASRAGDYVVGSTLIVDGGVTYAR